MSTRKFLSFELILSMKENFTQQLSACVNCSDWNHAEWHTFVKANNSEQKFLSHNVINKCSLFIYNIKLYMYLFICIVIHLFSYYITKLFLRWVIWTHSNSFYRYDVRKRESFAQEELVCKQDILFVAM